MKLAIGILIGWAGASLLLFAVLCWRALIEVDDAELRALAEIDPITPDPMFVADLLDYWGKWETQLTDEDSK